jgi:diguanylate cyclase (GGDEF)-like protein
MLESLGVTSDAAVACILIDIAGLARVTYSAGFQQSDAAIAKVAAWLESRARAERGCAFRIGGEEFLLVLPTADSPAALELAHDLVATCGSLRIPYPAVGNGREFLQINAVVANVTSSVGDEIKTLREWMADTIFQGKSREGREYGLVERGAGPFGIS